MKKRLGPLKTIEINYLHLRTSETNIKMPLNKISFLPPENYLKHSDNGELEQQNINKKYNELITR